MRIVSKSSSVQKSILLLTVSLMQACAAMPSLVSIPSTSEFAPSGDGSGGSDSGGGSSGGGSGSSETGGGSTTNPGGGSSETGGGSTTNPGGGSTETGGNPSCSMPQTLTANLQPSSSSSINLLMAIDDSGSMVDEIQEVVSKIQSFIQTLTSAVSGSDKLRLLLMFDTAAAAFSGVNPFTPYINNSTVKFVNQRTNSHSPDLAIYRSFALSSFMQIYPIPFPTDVRTQFSSWTPSNCSPNAYARPIWHTSTASGTPTSYCTNPADMTPIESIFEMDVPLNVAVFSDDDFNTRAPVVDGTFQALKAPLGSNTPYYYHSVVGMSAGGGIARVGNEHMALSAMTGGIVQDIRSSNYQQVLDNLARQAIFSSQRLNLACPVSATRPVRVFFDGQEIPMSAFQAIVGENSVLFNASAFRPGDEARMISVEVRY